MLAPLSATPKAIFIIVDGIPADIIEAALTPNIDDVEAAGGYTMANVGGVAGGKSDSPTISAVGYASLVTGTWANKHNVWNSDVAAPEAVPGRRGQQSHQGNRCARCR